MGKRKEYTSPYLSSICDVYCLFFMSTCMQGNRPGSIGDEWRTRGESSPACARVMPKPPRRRRVASSLPRIMAMPEPTTETPPRQSSKPGDNVVRLRRHPDPAQRDRTLCQAIL